MSLPIIPNDLTFENSIYQILYSIAMEEIGLSHIINVEGEKLQYVLGTLPGKKATAFAIEDLLKVNESVQRLLAIVSVNQGHLSGKMSVALDAYQKIKNGAGGPSGPGEPESPVSVTITTNAGTIIGDRLYLPQGATALLTAIVSGADGASGAVTWTHDAQPGFTFTGDGNFAEIKTGGSTHIGSALTVTAASVADKKKYRSKTVIVVSPDAKSVIIGGDGKQYIDYGDNTFKVMEQNGSTSGGFLCGGRDRIPGTGDDCSDVTVAADGTKYLGPNPDGSYQKAGADGLLGTADDIFVWKERSEDPMGPDNETADPPTPGLIRNIIITPSTATVIKGNSKIFTAAVYMSDGEIAESGVTWKVEPAGDASVSADGLLTIAPKAAARSLSVTATSKADTGVYATVEVTVQDAAPALAKIRPGESVNIDGLDWLKVRTQARDGAYYDLLLMKDVIFGEAVPYDTPGFNGEYATSGIRPKIDTWYGLLDAPVLKSLACPVITYASPSQSWPVPTQTVNRMLAFIPGQADIESLGAATLANGKECWTSTKTAGFVDDTVAQVTVKGDGSWGKRDAGYPNVYARPAIWARQS